MARRTVTTAKATEPKPRRHVHVRKPGPWIPVLIAIAGGSGSGKTWLAEKLERALGPRVARLSIDNFYLDRSHLPPSRRARINFDHPRAIDWACLEKALADLLADRSATVPVYDFKTHARLRSRRVPPQPLILLEGLWPLTRRAVRRLAHLSVFLNCPSSLRLRRRIQRDLAARGRTRASVERQFRDSVEPMHVRFVVPQRQHADVIIEGTCGPHLRSLVAKIKELLPGSESRL